MTTQKKERKVRTVKAWAIVHKKYGWLGMWNATHATGIQAIFEERKQAKAALLYDQALGHKYTKEWKIVECTITLPQ